MMKDDQNPAERDIFSRITPMQIFVNEDDDGTDESYVEEIMHEWLAKWDRWLAEEFGPEDRCDVSSL